MGVQMKNSKFTEIYEKYCRLIIKIALERIGDLGVAEEICQQVFVAYYQNMEQVEEKFIKPWLILTAKNATIDYLRKNSIRKSRMASEYWGSVEIPARDNTERIVESIASMQLSFRIMEDLKMKNEEWYQIIFMICVQGISQEEAAKYLQITPQVLRAKLYRARKYLRNKYGEEYDQS